MKTDNNTSFKYRLSRKFKKRYLGRVLNKSKLKRMIARVTINRSDNCRDSNEILPFAFCPNCGCRGINFGDNRAEYPERWVVGYCLRCGERVMESDNSPFWHVLEEIKDNA